MKVQGLLAFPNVASIMGSKRFVCFLNDFPAFFRFFVDSRSPPVRKPGKHERHAARWRHGAVNAPDDLEVYMELKVEAKNLEMRDSWLERIEEEKAKLIRHYANLVLHLRVTIEATRSYKEGGYEIGLVAGVPGDTVVVKRSGERVRPTMGEAFDVLSAQLKDIVQKRQDYKSGKKVA